MKISVRFTMFLGLLVIWISSTITQKANADLLDKVFAYWQFEETDSSQPALDFSTNANDGEYLSGANPNVDGAPGFGSGVEFDGTMNGVVDLGVTSTLGTLTNDFTLAGWIFPTDLTGKNRLLGSLQPDGWGFGPVGNGTLEVTTFGVKDYRRSFSFPENEWTHIAVVLDAASDATFYVNGDNIGTDPAGGPARPSSDRFFIGRASSAAEYFTGRVDEVGVFTGSLTEEEIEDHMLNGIAPREPFVIDGSGQTYFQDFNEKGTAKRMPEGWSGEDADGIGRGVDSLGLVDGPLEGAVFSAAGIVNVGGNAERFSSPADGRLGTWKDDLDGSSLFDEGDVIADDAADRALGNARVDDGDPGKLTFEIEITNSPVRAVTLEWDLEIWGGDPESVFRGPEGGGYAADLSVGGNSYYSETVSLVPGDLFDSSFDSSPGATHDPTLINGNEHSVRGNSSGILEISAADGAVGNTVNLTFDADHGGADGGWIQAVDNVQLRALAAGDAQADGDVDPADLIQLLAGGAFGQGNIDATWGQGDFDNDGDFDGTDILAVVQGLAGEFPKTYAHDPSNGVPDVLINPATGNITLDTNGTTIGSIVMDSAAGIFNGPSSPSWDAPGDFAADIDTQISMPISFTNPGYTGVDDLGDGIIGDLAPGFDILADLTIKYLDPNGDLLDAEAHVVPEPSSIVLAAFGVLGLMSYLWRRRRLS